MQRAKALNCTIPRDYKPSCSGQLFVGIFFDGTGNNLTADYTELPAEKRKHTNVVKLFRAYRANPEKGYFSYYIPGVGTPFPEIGDDGGTLGSVGAWDGENRIIWAFTRLLNAPNFYVNKGDLIPLTQAVNISNNLSSIGSPGMQRRMALHYWQSKLAEALKNKNPNIEQINLSVFGFSRGSAEARAFCNWLFEVCEKKGGGRLFAGIPIRIQFLGIFDTVASVGVANFFGNGIIEGHQSWAANNMQVHPAIEQCVHYVAAHEVRACFPSDSARIGKSYPANVKEVVYPGAHSDVGGGYAPNALGISPDPAEMMAIIPGVNMYKEALKAGVPLLVWGQLDPSQQGDFTPSGRVVAAFNGYLKDAAVGSGTVEEMHRKHMGLFFTYRYKYRSSLKSRVFYRRASNKDKNFLAMTEQTMLARLKSLQYPEPVDSDRFDPRKAAQLQRQMMKAAGLESQQNNDVKTQELYKVIDSIDIGKLTANIEQLFDEYVHDSVAGFGSMGVNEYDGSGVSLMKVGNGMGITRFRTIYFGNG